MFQNKVQKRDGSIVEFDPQKISLAINKAMLATKVSPKNSTLKKLTKEVVDQVEKNFPNEQIPSVEYVQDLVEKTLMKNAYYDTAKAYILYRSEQTKKREQYKTTMEMIQNHTLVVIKRDGSKELFDEQKLRIQITKYAEGLGELKYLDEIINSIIGLVRDNITTSEIAKLIYMTGKGYIERDLRYDTFTSRAFLANLYKEVFATSYDFDKLDKYYRSSFIKNIKKLVSENKLNRKILSFDLEKLSNSLILKNDNLFNYKGLQTLYDRYCIQDSQTNQSLESPQAFWMRVAMGLAMEEKDKDEKAIEFYQVLSSMLYSTGGRTLYHAGRDKAQLSNCFLLSVQDDLKDIFKYYGDQAQLSKWFGGIGTDWTNVRATGAEIKATGVTSQGLIPFLKIANDITFSINRGGKRHGATSVYLENWHLDYEDFLDLRRNTGDDRRRAHDMDTASWIPDLFMKRVEENGDWTMFSPEEVSDLHELYGKKFEKRYVEYEKMARDGKIKLFKVIKAADLWKKMITRLFETGHPWITFKDPCNIRSPQDHVGVIHNSNLCTEITLNTSRDEVAVCNLGSINLGKHIIKGKLDVKLLAKTVETAVRMLDNVIDINFYPIPEAKNANTTHRPIGLGILGYQDALYLQNIKFDSEEAVKFADYSMEVIAYYAYLASSKLAKEKGKYTSYKGSKWSKNIFPQDTIKILEEERGIKTGEKVVENLDWSIVRKHVKKYGMRNSNCLAIAPTATISYLSNSYPGIEPIYKNLYVKANANGEFTVNNIYLIRELEKLGLWTEDLLEKIKYNDGSIKNIPEIPKEIKEIYKEAFDIDPKWSILQAAARGKWIDQSQSLNIFTSTTSGKALSDIYFYAWKIGLKTTYYLRTLGASSIEKSTVNIDKAFTQSTKVAPAPVTVEQSSQPQPVKACLINDPGCESCQ